ncbi:menaquinone biosynthetic enzyme MqnA/MqnD family protein [Botrimarina hoheduenensis]|uniref:Chorismate dehydratase n=1 Tax=Botrimarina hoheduenensis TaxID=2528000 RepID=A0A5C5VNS9_9BACT|nr:menaquinone biosynthesis protein [Botrimarina hoheduenensis]TWT40264.1 Chorismate dehydratase [Botrimarina hoheduenensis]
MRVGAVNYLNSKPLIEGFAQIAPTASLRCDLPSRLADSLAAERLDVALIPTFEILSHPAYRIVSDACVASDGAVGSVKLYFRTPPEKVRTLALDEGSRTSAALSQVLLLNRHGVRPATLPLPIGEGLSSVTADAVLLIGDRAMHSPSDTEAERIVAAWDLGEEWHRDTGLPFVFACWAARAGIPTASLAAQLNGCRDRGVESFAEIADRESLALGLSKDHAERYLRENLRFHLGERELRALHAFRTAVVKAGLLKPLAATPAPLTGE